jgi:hypothetical protein
MRRSFVAVAVAAATFAGTTLADARVKKGSYSGETSQGLGVSFEVVKEDGAKRLADIEFRAELECSDGDSFTARGDVDDQTFTITRKGRYGYTSTGAGGASEYDFTGRIKGRKSRAKGEIRWTVRFNEQNQTDPNGSIVCDSGDVTYKARR